MVEIWLRGDLRLESVSLDRDTRGNRKEKGCETKDGTGSIYNVNHILDSRDLLLEMCSKDEKQNN